MSFSPILGNPKPQYEDTLGDPYVGMRLFFYVAGTSTKQDTVTDSIGGTTNTNPVVIGADGYPESNVGLYGDDTFTYKVVAAPVGSDDPPTSPLWTIDNVSPTNANSSTLRTDLANITSTTLGSFLVGVFLSATGYVGRTLSAWLSDRPYYAKDFGATGDGATDDVTAIGLWLDAVIASGKPGVLSEGTYLISTLVTKTIASGIKLTGNGVIKASGSNRQSLIVFDGAQGNVEINGITFDANNIAARALTIDNANAHDGNDVVIGNDVKIINAKNNTPDTFTAMGCYVRGGFRKLVFNGTIDTVDSSTTSGASSVGLNVASYAVSGQFIQHAYVGGQARFIDVKNDNATVADADGVRLTAQTTDTSAVCTVSPGAYFENCKGRAIKTQVANSIIDGAVILRDAYDGIIEIDVQYGGSVIKNNTITSDGFTPITAIKSSYRTAPVNKSVVVRDNRLVVLGSPATDVVAMIELDTTDATVAIIDGTISGNKAFGTVDQLINLRIADLTTNRAVIQDNWVDVANTSFLQVYRFGGGTPNISLVFENNNSTSSVTGATLSTTTVTVENEVGNNNITPIGDTLREYTISSGVITPIRRRHIDMISVDTEADDATDDLDTVTGTGFTAGDILVMVAVSNARTVVCKDGTGNIFNSGDFSMNNAQDTHAIIWNGSNWLQFGGSDNAA